MSPPPFQSAPPSDAPRFRRLLALVLLLGCAAQAAMIGEFVTKHPAAQFPLADGEVYWDMAHDMAGGQWMGDTPFLSAPLYPCLLGLMRLLGVTLTGVYILQAAMLVATAGLLACVARRRFGDNVGLVAAGVFLLLGDTAASSTRVLGNCVQLLLVVLLWQQWAALSESIDRRWGRVAVAGALLGLLALSYPAAMLIVPIFGAWVWWDGLRIQPPDPGSRHRTPLAQAALAVACASAAIAPATIHNWVVSHELIAITAHGGVTLCHGNQPQSKGTYTPIPGVAPGRIALHESAARLYEKETGQHATWRRVDRYFRNRAIDFWLGDPPAAARLLSAKAYQFFTWRNYDDICIVALDRKLGLADTSWLAPLAAPWVMGLALVGLLSLRHDVRRYSPEWVLPALTLFVVVVFFYSPRYRLPAAPILATLAALAVVRWRSLGVATPLAIGLALLLPALSVLNEVTHYDDPERAAKTYNHVISATYMKLAAKETRAGDQPAAQNALLAALKLEPDSLDVLRGLAVYYAQNNNLKQALDLFEKIAARTPNDLRSLRDLFHAYVSLGDNRNAEATLRRILAIKPESAVVQAALDSLLAGKRPGMLPPVEQW